MNSKFMSRAAAIGAAGALGAVALVGIAPSADAKPLATNYTCSLVGGIDTGVTIGLPSSVKAKDAKKGITAKSFTLTITLSEGLAGAVRGFTDTVGGSATGVTYKVGSTTAKVSNVSIKPTAVPESGPLVLKATATGKQTPFKLKKAGTYAITAPKSFVFEPTDGTGAPLPTGNLDCGLTDGAPSKVGSLKVK